MQIVDLDNAGMESAANALIDGQLVAVPTETVYGLAADATNDSAVAKIFAAKGRPQFNPLIAHVNGLDMARQFGKFDDISLKLVAAFWPGPLTLVVPAVANSKASVLVSAGLPTIGLRHPKGIMAKLAGKLDRPLAAPSANSSGKISPTSAQHVADDLGKNIAIIMDGGPCVLGLESTIVKIEQGAVFILRPGGISAMQLEDCLGFQLSKQAPLAKPESPGQLLTHYAPNIPLRLNVTELRNGEALLRFGEHDINGVNPVAEKNLSPDGNLEDAARNLFAHLHELDKSQASGIAVQSIPHEGIGVAINDRLKRAAHGSQNDD